jgi:ribosome-binding protein aMBF1 (putative translation factor)
MNNTIYHCDRCKIRFEDPGPGYAAHGKEIKLRTYRSEYHYYNEVCDDCYRILSEMDSLKRKEQSRSEEKSMNRAEREFRKQMRDFF